LSALCIILIFLLSPILHAIYKNHSSIPRL
jgi:hypothetical protein